MKNQLFFSLALLASVGSISAMVKDFNGPVTALFSSKTAVIATLPNGNKISLDPSIKWNLDNGILSPLANKLAAPVQAVQARAPQAPVAPTAPAPKAPAVQAVPKAAAATVANQHANGGCPKRHNHQHKNHKVGWQQRLANGCKHGCGVKRSATNN
jgi:hypothetical protein